MDSYEILNVTRDSSSKEIEVSYEDLKRKYDPSFNTSINAYKKYREILKAYEDIKDDQRRKMYNLKEDEVIISEKKKEYKLYDFNNDNEVSKEEININYETIENIKEVKAEDIVINKNISYLYYLLNLKCEVNYRRLVNCDECSNFVKCEACDGLRVVVSQNKHVWCPVCKGKGKVSKGCNKCDDSGSYLKEENISVFVDNEEMEIKGLGNEYYDDIKSNLHINFNFYDKEYFKVKDNTIKIDYHLSKEETINGVNKEYSSENGAFKVSIPSFVEDGYKEEITFNNKKIIFTFYNDKYDGNDKVYYLFINSEYQNKMIYFNNDYSKCSLEKIIDFNNEVVCTREIVIRGLGEVGKYEGNNGNLVIKSIFSNQKELFYSDKVEVMETSKLFNILGGEFASFKHYGFKGENSLVKKDNKYYLLDGKSKIKRKLKDYFLFKIASIALWFVSLLLLLLPYSSTMFITFIAVSLGYFILINLLMEVEV